MRSKGEMQSKLRHYMAKPRKILHKARDFYVKSMEDCASKVGYGGAVGCPTAQFSRLPRSFSVNYSKSGNDERFREVEAAVSKIIERQVALNTREEEQRQNNIESYGSMKRSYTSIGLGKIGRIDEERPCSFEDDKLYGRSRSYAAKRHFGYF